jgi:hypothetical protein
MKDLRYYWQATERRKVLESISSPRNGLYTIMEVMSCEELMDKKISCSVQSSALFHMVNCIVKTTINVIQSEISSIRIYLFL